MEFVYVVPRADLFDLHAPHGFQSLAAHGADISRWFERARAKGFFMERPYAEEHSSFKQLIPYTVVIRSSGPQGAPEVLLLRRSKKGGDARLHDKLSIGVGGHVNPEDAGDDLLAACARRELNEELVIDSMPDIVPVGVINDDSNAVGSVHFGVVHRALVGARTDVGVRETELLSARFVAVAELKRLAADPTVNLETWSKLIVERIEELLPPS